MSNSLRSACTGAQEAEQGWTPPQRNLLQI